MRFMMLMIPKGYEQAKPGTMPDPKAVEAMMTYNRELQNQQAPAFRLPVASRESPTGHSPRPRKWSAVSG